MCKSLPSLVFLDCLEGLVGQKKGESFSSLSLLTVNLGRLEAKGQKRGPKLKCKVVFLSHYFATVFVRQTYLARNASKWLGRCHCFPMACQENALLCRRNMILGSQAHPIPVKVGCGFPLSPPCPKPSVTPPPSPPRRKRPFLRNCKSFFRNGTTSRSAPPKTPPLLGKAILMRDGEGESRETPLLLIPSSFSMHLEGVAPLAGEGGGRGSADGTAEVCKSLQSTGT